ncbi:MAG: LysR family transcriptional regulator [Clostridia bacterium]|nr:LysR family transcriptional regulator [Clostridia bacterium]
MQIKDLEAVLAVYKYKSFSEAAFKLDFSISAISKQIAKVEEELGVKIFERKNKGTEMRLTRVGADLIPEIEKLLDTYSNIEYLASNETAEERNVLNIGYLPLIGTIGETSILAGFSATYPDIQINLQPGGSFDLLKSLMAGTIDAAFMMLFSAGPGNFKTFEILTNDDLKIVPIMKNANLYIGMSNNNPLAKRESVDLTELMGETFIFSNYQDPGRYETRMERLQKMISGKELELKARFMDFSNKDVVLSVVEQGLAVLPQVVMPRDNGYAISYVKVDNWPDQIFGLYVTRKSNTLPVLKELNKYVKEYVVKEGIEK